MEVLHKGYLKQFISKLNQADFSKCNGWVDTYLMTRCGKQPFKIDRVVSITKLTAQEKKKEGNIY